MARVTYKSKHFIWGSQFRRVRVHGRHGREHSIRKVGTELEQKLRAHILIFKQEAERMNGAGNGMVL